MSENLNNNCEKKVEPYHIKMHLCVLKERSAIDSISAAGNRRAVGRSEKLGHGDQSKAF